LLLIALALPTGARVAVRRGIVEAWGGLIRYFLLHCLPLFRGAGALTLGHVVVACDETYLDRWREHEFVHVGQFERWGPAFLPAYFLSTFLQWVAGNDPYVDNYFERKAYSAVPGVLPPPRRLAPAALAAVATIVSPASRGPQLR
jgi:hypothetical protein